MDIVKTTITLGQAQAELKKIYGSYNYYKDNRIMDEMDDEAINQIEDFAYETNKFMQKFLPVIEGYEDDFRVRVWDWEGRVFRVDNGIDVIANYFHKDIEKEVRTWDDGGELKHNIYYTVELDRGLMFTFLHCERG